MGRKKLKRKQKAETKQSRWGFRGMTVRDWLELLIVPLALVLIGFYFTSAQDELQRQIEEDQRAEQAQIEERRAAAEQALAEQRAQDEALQAYLSQMGSLLLEKDLRESDKGTEVRTLARARTLTVLGRVDPSHKTALMQFLVEADLVQRVDGRDPIISLRGADLNNANLLRANLHGVNLSGANLINAELSVADLSNADLSGFTDLSQATLDHADLFGADLSDADLINAGLFGADLSNANLSRANVGEAVLYTADLSDADLSNALLFGADLSYANLSRANLSDAKLRDAKLRDANLNGASGVTNEKVAQQASSLEGATMPNGQKYEDWLKDKKAREEGEKNE